MALVCVFFLHIQRNKTKSSHCCYQCQDYPFILSVQRFCHKRKQEKSQDRLGKDVCNSLEIRIKLKLAPTSTLRIGTINWKLAPTSTLRIGTINWKFASHKTPKCPGLYLSVDSQDGLNYLGRIIACCSMRIVWRTGGVVVCTLCLHAKGPWFKSWQVVHIDWE